VGNKQDETSNPQTLKGQTQKVELVDHNMMWQRGFVSNDPRKGLTLLGLRRERGEKKTAKEGPEGKSAGIERQIVFCFSRKNGRGKDC